MNHLELKAAIARRGLTARGLAGIIGMPEATMSTKMHGRTEFKGSEIQAIAKALELNMQQVNQIFFGESVN